MSASRPESSNKSQSFGFCWDFILGRLGVDEFERRWPDDPELMSMMANLLASPNASEVPALTVEQRMANAAKSPGIKFGRDTTYPHNATIPDHRRFIVTAGAQGVDPGPIRAFLMYQAYSELCGLPLFRLGNTQALLEHGRETEKYESGLAGQVGASLMQKNLVGVVRKTGMAERVKKLLPADSVAALEKLPPRTLEHISMYGILLTRELTLSAIRALMPESDESEGAAVTPNRLDGVLDRLVRLLQVDLERVGSPEPVAGGLLERMSGSAAVAAASQAHRQLNSFVQGVGQPGKDGVPATLD